MLEKVRRSGFVQSSDIPNSQSEFFGKRFYVDTHCNDVLVFSTECSTNLYGRGFMEEGYLVRQVIVYLLI